ncbi:MAG: TraR/DksA C4-type zinc finger protein [Pseudomonadota bacterium]
MFNFSFQPQNIFNNPFVSSDKKQSSHTHLAQRLDGSYIELNIDSTEEDEVSIIDPMPSWDEIREEPSFKELHSFSIAKTPTASDIHGRCIDCGKTITYKRSSNLAVVKRCTRCQSIHELTYETGHFAFI